MLLKVLFGILGVSLIGCGIYLLTVPEVTFLMLAVILGINIIISSVVMFCKWCEDKKQGQSNWFELATSIISAIFSVILLTNGYFQFAVDMFIVYSAAIWMIIMAVTRIMTAFHQKKMNQNIELKPIMKYWWINLIVGVLYMVAGIFGIANPVLMAIALGIVVAINVILTGFTTTTLAFAL